MKSLVVLVLFIGLPLQAQTTQAVRERLTIKGHGGWVSGVAFTPDGKYLLVSGGTRTISVFDTSTGKKLMDLKDLPDFVPAVAHSPVGKHFAAAGYEGGVHVSVVQPDGVLLKTRALTGHRGAVMTVAFQPEGGLLASGGLDGKIRLWDLKVGKELALLEGNKSWVNSLAFSKDGKTLASAGSDGTVRLWDVDGRKERGQFELDNPLEVRGVALSPDGKMVAAAIRFGKVKVWDLETRKELATLDAHKGEGWTVAFSPDSKLLASGGGDWAKPSEVRLWDTTSWRESAALKHTGEV